MAQKYLCVFIYSSYTWIYLYIHLFISFYLSIYIFIYLSTYLFHLSIFLSLNLPSKLVKLPSIALFSPRSTLQVVTLSGLRSVHCSTGPSLSLTIFPDRVECSTALCSQPNSMSPGSIGFLAASLQASSIQAHDDH